MRGGGDKGRVVDCEIRVAVPADTQHLNTKVALVSLIRSTQSLASNLPPVYPLY